MPNTSDPLVARFVALAICIGYAHDTGRSKLADEVHPDFELLRGRFLDRGAAGIASLRLLLNLEGNSWVCYLAATALLKSLPEEAMAALKFLKTSDGMVSILASVTLGTYVQLS